MTYQTIFAGAAVVVAVVALARSRRTAKRLERMTESYWELRYEHSQLRSRLAALEPPQAQADTDVHAARQPAPTAFVPLSSLKR